MQDRDITAAEASALFGIHRNQITRWVQAHKLFPVDVERSPGCKGQTAKYRLSEVAALVADRHEQRHADESELKRHASSDDV